MSTRHTCAVCNRRRPIDHYPLSSGDQEGRLLGTCVECLDVTFMLGDNRQQQLNALGIVDVRLETQSIATPVDPAEEQTNAENVAVPRRSRRHVDDKLTDLDNLETILGESAPGPELTPIPAPSKKRKRRGEDCPLKSNKARKDTTPNYIQPKEATCRICLEDKAVSEYPKAANGQREKKDAMRRPWLPQRLLPGEIPQSCAKHLAISRWNKQGPVCKECIGNSLGAGLDLKPVESLGCLDENCDATWDSTDHVAPYLLTEDTRRYSELLLKTFTATNKKIKHCLNKECGVAAWVDTTRQGYP
ncbi:hypothetical protein Vi05172_g728 [Venturia inaequalis]|nr:hypothetical protein Vi05172_g728 [Venturia inaequalis]